MHHRLIRYSLALTLGLVGSSAIAQEEGVIRKKSPPFEAAIAAFRVQLDDIPRLTEAQRATAHAAGHRLVSLCPDCRLSTISEEGPCGWARTQRRIIEAAVANGWSEDDIVKTYVSTYGTNILSVPKDRGLASMSWILPYVLAGLGLVVTMIVGLRLAKRRAHEPAESKSTPNPEAYDALRAELDALD